MAVTWAGYCGGHRSAAALTSCRLLSAAAPATYRRLLHHLARRQGQASRLQQSLEFGGGKAGGDPQGPAILVQVDQRGGVDRAKRLLDLLEVDCLAGQLAMEFPGMAPGGVR